MEKRAVRLEWFIDFSSYVAWSGALVIKRDDERVSPRLFTDSYLPLEGKV